jgi:hypothetical protein
MRVAQWGKCRERKMAGIGAGFPTLDEGGWIRWGGIHLHPIPTMADPHAATLTQLRNIQAKTGKSIAELHAALAKTELAKVSERRSWLMEAYKLGYGDANTVALLVGKLPKGFDAVAAAPAAVVPVQAGDPLDSIYAGAKAHLRGLHDAVLAAIAPFGEFEQAPKKSYVSLRRKKQFAMVGPATKELVEIGLNAKGLSGSARLKTMPAGGMCAYTVRLARAEEIDEELRGWLRRAFDSAG